VTPRDILFAVGAAYLSVGLPPGWFLADVKKSDDTPMKFHGRKGSTRMAANDKTNDKTQDPGSATDAGPTAWQRHRRAQMEWMRATQAAQLYYQRQIAEANVVHHTSLHAVTDESWNRRLKALDAGNQAPDTPGQTAEITREFAHGVNEADRVAQEAYGRAWYGLQDALQAANAKYVVATGDLFRAAGGGVGIGAAAGGMFAAGDEGPVLTDQPFNPATQFWGALGRM